MNVAELTVQTSVDTKRLETDMAAMQRKIETAAARSAAAFNRPRDESGRFKALGKEADVLNNKMSDLASRSSLTFGSIAGGAGGAAKALGGIVMSFTAIAASALAMGATLSSVFRSAYNAVEEYTMATTKMGILTLAMMDENQGKSFGEMFKQSKEYAQGLVKVMEEIDAQTLMNAHDLQVMTQEMAKQGQFLDYNNAKQVEGFKNLANAVAILAQGGSKEMQIRQEVRALLNGEIGARNVLASNIDAMIGGSLKKEVELHKKSGDLLEWLASKMKAYAAYTGDIETTWEAIGSTLESIRARVLRLGFTEAYAEINRMLADMSKWLKEHEEQVGGAIKEAWDDIKSVLQDITQIIVSWAPLFDPLIERARFWIDILLAGSKIFSNILSAPAKAASAADAYFKSRAAEAKGDTETAAKEMKKAIDLTFQGSEREGERGPMYFLRRAAKLPPDEASRLKGELGDYRYDPEAARLKGGEGRSAFPKFKTPGGEDEAAGKIEKLNQKIRESIMKLQGDEISLIQETTKEWVKQGADKKLVTEYTTLAMAEYWDKYWAGVRVESSRTLKSLIDDEYKYRESVLSAEKELSEKKLSLSKERGEVTELDLVKNKYAWENKILDLKIQEAETGISATSETDYEAFKKYREQLSKAVDAKGELAKTQPIDEEMAQWKMRTDAMDIAKEYARDYRLFREEQLEILANKMRAGGIAEVDIQRWVSEQIKQISLDQYKHQIEYAESYHEAIEAMLNKMVLEQKSSYQKAAEMIEGSFGDMKSSLSDVFFDGLKGELKSFEDYWNAFTDRINKRFADMLADMVVDWIVAQAKMIMQQGASSWASTLLGFGSMAWGGGYGGAAATGTYGLEMAGGGFEGMAAAGFAEGGRPPVGVPSVVGEKGPEVFVPDVAGMIISNRDLKSIISGLPDQKRKESAVRQNQNNLFSIDGSVKLDFGTKQLGHLIRKEIESNVPKIVERHLGRL